MALVQVSKLIFWFMPICALYAQTPDAARKAFESRCSGCHGADGNGGELGPQYVAIAAGSDIVSFGLIQ